MIGNQSFPFIFSIGAFPILVFTFKLRYVMKSIIHFQYHADGACSMDVIDVFYQEADSRIKS